LIYYEYVNTLGKKVSGAAEHLRVSYSTGGVRVKMIDPQDREVGEVEVVDFMAKPAHNKTHRFESERFTIDARDLP